jgi:hypothetical protein
MDTRKNVKAVQLANNISYQSARIKSLLSPDSGPLAALITDENSELGYRAMTDSELGEHVRTLKSQVDLLYMEILDVLVAQEKAEANA